MFLVMIECTSAKSSLSFVRFRWVRVSMYRRLVFWMKVSVSVKLKYEWLRKLAFQLTVVVSEPYNTWSFMSSQFISAKLMRTQTIT